MPGNLGVPILGQTVQFGLNPPQFGMRWYRRYGPISQMRLLGEPVVLAVGGDAAMAVLDRRDRTFASGEGWKFWVGAFFRGGMPLLDFEEHERHRRLVRRAFERDRLEGYLEQLYRVLSQDLSVWKPQAQLRAEHLMRAVLLRAQVRILMGGGLGSEAGEIERALRDCIDALKGLRMRVPGGAWARGLTARRKLEELFLSRIPVMPARGGDEMFAFLCRAALEDGTGFTEDDLVNEMIFLLYGSFDPTAISTVAAIRYLAEYPRWQAQCRSESFALRTYQPGIDDLDKLQSLDLVIREALRLEPPFAMCPNVAAEDTTLLGHDIPKGTLVVVTSYINHRLEEYWSEPEVFDPLRFAEHRREDQAHEGAWIPFGTGVHKCLGMHLGMLEMKAVVHQLLMRASWRVAPGYTPKTVWRGIARQRDGLPIVLE